MRDKKKQIKDIRCLDTGKVRGVMHVNPFIRRMMEEYRYRTVMLAFSGLVLNVIFALFHGVVGIYSQSAWYGTLSAYYMFLSVMRFLTVRSHRTLSQRDRSETLSAGELSVYHRCGVMFLVMTAALAGMVILVVCEEGGKRYPGFLIYGVAAYTFYKVIISVVNLVKVRKFNSPLLLAIRDIGYIDACVSVLSLQTAMLAEFGKGQEFFVKTVNGATGAAVCLLVFGIGIYSICSANRMKEKSAEAGGMEHDKNTCSGR